MPLTEELKNVFCRNTHFYRIEHLPLDYLYTSPLVNQDVYVESRLVYSFKSLRILPYTSQTIKQYTHWLIDELQLIHHWQQWLFMHCFSNRNWKGLRYSAWWREVTSWRRGWGQHAKQPNGLWLDSSWMASSPPPWSRSSGSNWSQQWLQSCLRKNRGITQPKASLWCHMVYVCAFLSVGKRVLVMLCASHLPSLIRYPQTLCSHFTSPHSTCLNSQQLL